jgi:hypothetical protein
MLNRKRFALVLQFEIRTLKSTCEKTSNVRTQLSGAPTGQQHFSPGQGRCEEESRGAFVKASSARDSEPAGD